MAIIEINQADIAQTLTLLKSVGPIECVVLWLGKKADGVIKVHEVYRPKQRANVDFFHLPEESMSELFGHLRKNRLMVAAQVHTHPGLAFHSKADDKWAIIRHEGGLSFVLPYFAVDTSIENFTTKVALFKLSERNRWREVPPRKVQLHYKVTP